MPEYEETALETYSRDPKWEKIEEERQKREKQMWDGLHKDAVDLDQTQFLIVFRRYLAQYPEFKYDLLKTLSTGRVHKKTYPREQLKSSRRSFDKSFRKRPYKLGKCFICDFPPLGVRLIRHHMIALSNWGTNRRLNIITLCSRCHCYFHPWLWDEWNETHKIAVEYAIQGLPPRMISPKASAYHS